MRKSNKGKKSNLKKKASTQEASSKTTDLQKRNSLSKLKNIAIGLIIAGAASTYFYNAFQKDVAEKDLTKIGKGKPYVVQIHDPNCPICTALQKLSLIHI